MRRGLITALSVALTLGLMSGALTGQVRYVRGGASLGPNTFNGDQIINGLLGIGVSPSSRLHVYEAVAGLATLRLENPTGGVANGVQILLRTDANSLVVDGYSTAFSTSTFQHADGGAIYTTRPGGISLAAIHASGDIRFYAGGTTEVMRVEDNGLVTMTHPAGGSTVPAVSNTSANSCGTTAATIVGTDAAGKITVGATAGTSCTVTFVLAWPNSPACTVTNEITANLARATSTTTTVILAGTFVAGDVLSYQCLGY